jgi:hypothetical protein
LVFIVGMGDSSVSDIPHHVVGFFEWSASGKEIYPSQ